MKRFACLLAICVGIVWLPTQADAHCYGGCYNAVETVAVPYAVPVAVAAPYTWLFATSQYAAPAGYVAPQAAAPATNTNTQTVSLDGHAIAQEVIAGITPSIQKGIDANHAELMATIAAFTGAPNPPAPAPTTNPTPAEQPTPPSPAPAPARASPQATAAPANGAGLFATNCLRCHSATATDKRPHFEALERLTCEQKLTCARAILSTAMPKGKKLTADEAGALLTELTAAPQLAKAP